MKILYPYQKFSIVLVFLVFSNFLKSQTIYNPTLVYDTTGQLFDRNQIQSLYITFNDANYHDTLTAWWFSKNETRLLASLDMNGIHFDSIGVKYKGNSTFFIANSLSNPKVPYNIDVNEYVGGQKLMGYKKLKLGNALFDPSFTKEGLASYIYNQYLPSHQTTLMQLFVNGTYLGLYTSTESINKQFLQKHFNEKTGAFYKCEPSAQYGTAETNYPADLIYRGTDTLQYNLRYERKSDSSWTNLIHFIDVLNNDPANIESVLNVDRVLWFFAVNSVILNEDAYNTMYVHNYYVYQLGDGRFQIIPWDLSESFVGGLLANLSSYNDHYQRNILHGLTPLVNSKPLVYQLLNNPNYKKTYLAHINTIIEENLDTTAMRNWINSWQSNAFQAMSLDPNNLFSDAQFYTNIDSVIIATPTIHLAAIMETMRNRIPYLQSVAALNQTQPTISNVSQNLQLPLVNESVYITAQVTNATNVNLMTTISPYASGFLPTPMHDDGINGDAIAGDNIFTALVPHQNSLDHVKYYIKAKNSNTVKLQPQKAEYFYYHYTVDAYLNQIKPEKTSNFLNIYPNPAHDFIQIQTINFENGYSLQVFDINGKIITESFNNYNGQLTISTSHLENGFYFIRIFDGTLSQTQKFIVKH